MSSQTGELIERCLAKSPAARFPSFEEVLRYARPASDAASPWDDPEDPSVSKLLVKYQARKPSYLGLDQLSLFPDVYTMASGRKLKIVRGSIVSEKVEAVVSSDDETLSMGGGVSRALRLAAGPAMVLEARKYSSVRPGRAVVTSAGKMSQRFIFHGVTLDYSKRSMTPSRDLILEILASCFYHADSLNVRTIAFPLLGTGVGSFPIEVCLDATFHYLIRTLSKGMTSVEEATIVLYDGWQC